VNARPVVLSLAGAIIACGGEAPRPPQGAASIDIAVHPLAIHGRDSVMQAQAESCLTGMIRALAAEHIAATLVPPAAPRGDLQTGVVARFSIEGEVEKVGGDYRLEVRLMDAATGDELRSYYFSGEDPAGIGRLGPAAAPRIAQAVRETPSRP
jgi:TolB-like protein